MVSKLDDFRTDIRNKYTPVKLLLVSLISAVFILYPNISIFSLEREHLGVEKQTVHLLYFIFRFLFFSALIWLLINYNVRKIKLSVFSRRLIFSFLITAAAYVIYIGFSILLSPKPEWLSGMLAFQFLVMFVLCALVGHVTYLYAEQRRKEQEIEQLKIENLQSRYDALTNQINPHFFFNSLNGLTSLIRKKNDINTLEYVNKLSDVFRYILQSDKKILVTLEEELEFVQAFLFMMEVRFANKILFNINVEQEKRDLKLPVLSLLPLIENVVLHNTIDSDHKMEVNIWLNDKTELVVSNPVFPKLTPPDTNGTGLKNLQHRFSLLMSREIRIENDGERFFVYLPLK
ncbi:MAG: histidine kinase [Bacteroidota bacterium]